MYLQTFLAYFFIPAAFAAHTDNWAVIVDTSRFWFNYRHAANALSVYRSVKRLGIPDSHIILMLADDFACNPRNPMPGQIYSNKDQAIDVYGQDVEVDYRGEDVTVHNVIRVLTDRVEKGTPSSKRLDTTKDSNILIYMTGHGGDDFLKFQEQEELTSDDLADAIGQMQLAKRYNEIMLIVDTCQAATLYRKIYSPNVIAITSSLKGEDSLSHHADRNIGVFVIDRFTYHLLEFLEKIKPGVKSRQTVGKDLFAVCPKYQCVSTANHQVFDMDRDVDSIPVTDFFSGVRFLTKTDSEIVVSGREESSQRYDVHAVEIGEPDRPFREGGSHAVDLKVIGSEPKSCRLIEALLVTVVVLAMYIADRETKNSKAKVE